MATVITKIPIPLIKRADCRQSGRNGCRHSPSGISAFAGAPAYVSASRLYPGSPTVLLLKKSQRNLRRAGQNTPSHSLIYAVLISRPCGRNKKENSNYP